MIKLVFEGAYKPGYDPKLKLKTFNEYFSKIPNSSSTFVKLINFAGDVSILNVVGVELSENLHDPSTQYVPPRMKCGLSVSNTS